jgi:hypothetical protein
MGGSSVSAPLLRRLTPVLVLLMVFLTACGASYDDRIEYLHKIALGGVETHTLLQSQGAEVDKKSCESANAALNNDAPDDIGGPESRQSQAWSQLVEQTFVNACVSGKY